MKKLYILAMGACLVCAGVLVGCEQSLFQAHRVSVLSDAGSVSLAAVSAGPWEEYQSDLQPHFTMDEAKALEQAMPRTLAMDDQFIDLLKASLKLNLPTSGTTETETTTSSTGHPTTQSVTETSTKAPGSMPAGSPDLPTTRGSVAKLDEKLANPTVDPMLKYATAAALYQEVKLLNRYVTDAALAQGYEPYVVRLQVAVLPKARNEPYDIYLTASFFDGPFLDRPAPLVENKHNPRPMPATIPGVQPSKPSGGEPDQPVDPGAGNVKDRTGQHQDDASGRTPIVVPLLVTDDLETAIHSRSVDVVRQYAVALTAVINGMAMGGDLAKFDERLQSVLGQDLNSTLTMARLSDNTVKVRLGAAHQATSHYAMVSQTHYVSVLVMVPTEWLKTQTNGALVRVMTHASFTDAETGKDLKEHSIEELRQIRKAIVEKVAGKEKKVTMDKVDELVKHVSLNQYLEFAAAAVDLTPFPELLWVDLLSEQSVSQYHFATTALPPIPQALAIEPENQLVALMDDKKKAVCVVRGVSRVPSRNIHAELKVNYTDPVTSQQAEARIPATKIDRDIDGGTMSLEFPTLTTFAAYKPSSVEIAVSSEGLDGTASKKTIKPVVLIAAKDSEASDKVAAATLSAANTSLIVDDKDHGSATAYIQLEKLSSGGSITFKSDTADIVSIEASPSTSLKDGAVTSPCRITLHLTNVQKGTDFIIQPTLKPKDGDATPLQAILFHGK